MIDISDRKSVFYWQTDRKLTAEDYDRHFLKRHEVLTPELVSILQNGVTVVPGNKDITIIEPDENVLKGNVNIVRKVDINDESFVVRMHPKGIKNGYFYVEKVALEKAQEASIPVPQIIEVHEARDENDMDFVLMSESKGITLESAIRDEPQSEPALLFLAGALMAKIHTIEVDGYGSFDNQIAKNENRLVGLHNSYKDFIWTGLEENLERLVTFEVITQAQSDAFKNIFESNNYEPIGKAILVHNDYADWNLLVNEGVISAVLDWDECHAGDPVADLACWSTFFTMERFQMFLEGYKSIGTLPDDFDDRFHFYRLRYTISKMALRVKRAQVDFSDSLKERIRVGEKALEEEKDWFK
jgi:aminoglycoside phosphotransferase (APT) family kinase protein